MEAYLKTQELWYCVEGIIEWPTRLERPIDPTVGVDATKVSTSTIELYEARMKIYDQNSAEVRNWI